MINGSWAVARSNALRSSPGRLCSGSRPGRLDTAPSAVTMSKDNCRLPEATRHPERHVMWIWHWWVFLVAIIPCYFFVGFTRGATNAANVEKYGPSADYE